MANGFQPLTIFAKRSILDVGKVLNTRLKLLNDTNETTNFDSIIKFVNQIVNQSMNQKIMKNM